MRIGRQFLYSIRNYLRPSDYRGYLKTVRELRDRGAPESLERSVVFDFTKPMIDKDLGRYAFNLVREFLDAGYCALLPPNFWYLSSVHRKVFKRLLLELPVYLFDAKSNGQQQPTLLLTDRASSPYRGHCVHEIRLDYTSRLHRDAGLTLIPYRPAPTFDHDAAMPEWPDLEDEGRPIPVSFLGHWKHSDYDNTQKLAEFRAYGRRDLIESLLVGLSPEQVVVAGREASPELEGAGKFFLTRDDSLPALPGYAKTLRHSNFFLCCPGTGFLLCHNMIESMLMGCIPIVQRPELTGLPLVAGENCLSFDSLDGLTETVRECLADGAARAPAMRARLREVVREHLEPGCFARKLDVDGGRLPESLALFWFERAW